MVNLITYDLNKPQQNYNQLYEEIKKLGSWWHYLDSTWLVDTQLSPQQVWELIAPKVDKNDSVFVVRITSSHSGWLNQEAWDWINSKSY
ncbi:MAG: hypothetical protein KW793_04105 [Candidatus Doudnabacteria bacterium]|nr:hypothetical protein [Candidatus Doudnabacteria bacterium]